MHWLYLLMSFAALLLAITTVHGWLLLVALLAALGFFIAWIRGWYLDRIGGRQQDEMAMIDPVELRRLRELAEARKREAATPPSQGPAPPVA